MAWNTTPVQVKTASGSTATATVTLDAAPAVGNTLLVGGVTSNVFNPVNDGWVLDATNGTRAQFCAVYGYYRVVAAGDDLTALRTFTRSLSAADRWALAIVEFAGTGPFSSVNVLDQSSANALAIAANSISTLTTPTLGQPDGLAAAIFAMPRLLTAGAGAFGPYTNGFAEIVEVGATGGDAPDVAIAVRDVGNSTAGVEATATIAVAGTPTNEHRPLALLFVFKTDPPVAIARFLSGGAANADPGASIGGLESSVQAPAGLLDDVSRLQADTVGGWTDYRLEYVRNLPNLRHLSATVGVYIAQQPANWTLALGVATQAAGVTVPALANETTAPAGVTFSSPTTEGAALNLGLISEGVSRGLYLRRSLPAGAGAFTSDPAILRFVAVPA